MCFILFLFFLFSLFFQQRQEGVRVVGRISRLVPEKDPETFVRAAALLAHQDKLVFQYVV